MSDVDFSNIPYAQWLENAIRELVEIPVRGICIVATTNNGGVHNNYYNVTMVDKLVMAGLIQQDATIEVMSANEFIEYVEDEEEDIDGTEEE